MNKVELKYHHTWIAQGRARWEICQVMAQELDVTLHLKGERTNAWAINLTADVQKPSLSFPLRMETKTDCTICFQKKRSWGFCPRSSLYCACDLEIVIHSHCFSIELLQIFMCWYWKLSSAPSIVSQAAACVLTVITTHEHLTSLTVFLFSFKMILAFFYLFLSP